MNDRKTDEGVLAADRAREELYETLALLRDRLDYAARFDRRAEEVRAKVADVKREKPLVFVLGVATAAAGVGLVAWGIARKFLVKK